mmetsp:Transcript_74020/g.171718  ORF Transcript_74020/g.171718 Transcript_74020/m.171718 type:complete len:115 (+) Transcript_74020:77-421(+)|eukprot:CAMPEP_0171094676 /NCGR_PEP_ID=MMETSP0766_2-20121228/41989_1 /TAXON_ID=439317 /ORGANISM="Gambierdiscus australes, Strain CAWD 149" /LENGTH=114 /DNA_ID=CAMNT_0011553365 /DNA_START=71 /DNA_END=415 /DNA_ORIENTATION=-
MAEAAVVMIPKTVKAALNTQPAAEGSFKSVTIDPCKFKEGLSATHEQNYEILKTQLQQQMGVSGISQVFWNDKEFKADHAVSLGDGMHLVVCCGEAYEQTKWKKAAHDTTCCVQ